VYAPSDADPPGIELALSATSPRLRCEFEFGVRASGVTALFGRSGSGKTTCLRLFAGLERGRGSLHAFGECWQDDTRRLFIPTHRRGVGYVFQEPSLFAHLCVRDNLRYAEQRRPWRQAATPAFDAVVDMFGVSPLLDRLPEALSGGERQRAAIARALLAAPRLLLMDEPLGALDDDSKGDVMCHLDALCSQTRVPIIYVSHSLDEVARLADDVVLIDAGRVVATGPVSDMLSRLDLSPSRSPDAAVVIDARVGLHDHRDLLTRLDFGGDTLWAAGVEQRVGSRVRARVLARDVSVALEKPGPSSILNVLPATVQEIADDGSHSVTVCLSLKQSDVVLLARITRRSRDALGLARGRAVYAQVKGVALFT
jgi:molybdate transport system ATP-binding protein